MHIFKGYWKILIFLIIFMFFVPLASTEAAPVEKAHDGQMTSVQSGKVCTSKWTGRWIITYQRSSPGHYVSVCKLYVPSFIDNENDAQNWRWSPEYVAQHCSLPDEPQTWQGTFLSVQKEMIKVCTWEADVPPKVEPPKLELF